MNNIIVLAAGRRVELIKILKRDLAARIPDASVFACDVDPGVSAACQAADEMFESLRIDQADYLGWLLDLCMNRDIGLVIPTIDTELQLLANARERFQEHGITLVVSDPEAVADCRDKRRTAELFASISVETPEIFPRTAIRYPAFAKPYDGSRSIGAAPLWGAADLTATMLADEKMIFMALIGDDHDEFTVDAYYDREGTLQCLVPRQRLEVRSGEVSKGLTRRAGVYDHLSSRLGGLKGMRGCITLQVFAHSATERVLGIEINPRFGGGFPLTDAAGAHYGGWLIDEYLLGRPVSWFDTWTADLLMLRYDAQILVERPVG